MKLMLDSFIDQTKIMQNSTSKTYNGNGFTLNDGIYEDGKRAAGAFQIYLVKGEENTIKVCCKNGAWFDWNDIAPPNHAAFSWVKADSVRLIYIIYFSYLLSKITLN